MADRTNRTWRLIKASTGVIKEDGELLLLPILCGVVATALLGALMWQAIDSGLFDAVEKGDVLSASPSFYAWLFVFYIAQHFVLTFFNVALVGAAIDRLDGGDPTIRSALGLAFRRLPAILGYAVMSATVGVFLRMVGDRGGIVGRIFAAGLEFAWSIATFLVVPVIAAEGAGPWEAIERSGQLLRKTWGENIIGSSGIAVVTGFAAAAAAFSGLGGFYLFDTGNTLGIPVMGIGFFAFVAIVAFGSALSAVYSAALYAYAVLGEPPSGFDKYAMQDAFERKELAV